MKTIIAAAALALLAGCASTTSPAYNAAPGYRSEGVQGVDYVTQTPPADGWVIKGSRQK